MKVYIDSDFKCHKENADGRREFDVDFFDGKCEIFVEGYRFVPSGEEWTRNDGKVFPGEMISPCRNNSILEDAQSAYNEANEITMILTGEVEIDDEA